jgi:hypothetical protein
MSLAAHIAGTDDGGLELVLGRPRPPVLFAPDPAALAALGSPIRWLERPEADEYGGVTLGHYGGWAVRVQTMIYNDRVCLAPDEWGIHYSWCFPKGGAAHLAVMVWNPDTEGEPAGYIKAAARYTYRSRTAGERAPHWHPPLA